MRRRAARVSALRKPVYALIAGREAKEGVSMGHAGALVLGEAGTLASKTQRLSGPARACSARSSNSSLPAWLISQHCAREAAAAGQPRPGRNKSENPPRFRPFHPRHLCAIRSDIAVAPFAELPRPHLRFQCGDPADTNALATGIG